MITNRYFSHKSLYCPWLTFYLQLARVLLSFHLSELETDLYDLNSSFSLNLCWPYYVLLGLCILGKPLQKREGKISSETQQHFHEIPEEKTSNLMRKISQNSSLTKEAKCLGCVSRSFNYLLFILIRTYFLENKGENREWEGQWIPQPDMYF